MSFFDFIIRKECKFTRNVLDKEQLKKALKSLTAYYEFFQKFLKIFILLEDNVNDLTDFDQIVDDDLKNFCEHDCAELLDKIKKLEIKTYNKKKPKLTLQYIGFFYSQIMDFPNSEFSFKLLLLLIFLHRITKVKLYLHHSHVTGKIYGHDNVKSSFYVLLITFSASIFILL